MYLAIKEILQNTYEFLREHGAVAIFGPGTVLPVAAKKLLETLTSHVQDESHD